MRRRAARTCRWCGEEAARGGACDLHADLDELARQVYDPDRDAVGETPQPPRLRLPLGRDARGRFTRPVAGSAADVQNGAGNATREEERSMDASVQYDEEQGTYAIGGEIDGIFVPFYTLPATTVDSLVQSGKAAQEQAQNQGQ